MHSIAWFCLLPALVAQAVPLLETRENENIHITTGEPARDRTIFVVVAIFCSSTLAFLLGSRIQRLKRGIRSRRNLTSSLLLAIYITVICFIVISAAVFSGQGLYTHELCTAITWICLVFYTVIKGLVHAFLVERIHVVRAPFVRRSKDKIYLACLLPALVMYIAVTINSYFWRITSMHNSDGRCHFGIQSKSSIPLFTVNVLTNLFLTGAFFYLLRPVVKLHGVPSLPAGLRHESKTEKAALQTCKADSAVQRNIKLLLWKSIIGAILIELPVVANMIRLMLTGGVQLGMICLTFCMADAVWDVLVIHWLTFGSSAVAEKHLLRSTKVSLQQALTRQQDSVPSRCSSQRQVQETGVRVPANTHIQAPRLEIGRTDSTQPFLSLSK